MTRREAVTQVVATAGHVDHGKSTLVRGLTRMEPDRWAEERRRGLTIDLGFAWTGLPSGTTVAFVDVPGHERFISNMLAGVGPVPAVMIVVAADEGWSVQSAEHLAALDALGVRHGLLVVTKSDLADPGPARAEALRRIAATSLGTVESVCVSGVAADRLGPLRDALDRLVAALPAPDPSFPVRLWVDRAFPVHGAGTVVTGTLAAGTLRVGDELDVVPGGRRVTVRGLQTLKRSAREVTGVARVAVNLRHVAVAELHRGAALTTPGAWAVSDHADVQLDVPADTPAGGQPGGGLPGRGMPGRGLPAQVRCHIGAAAVTGRVRPLGTGLVRLSFTTGLPLHVGDRLLLRDPGSRRITPGTVLDPWPPPLRRRGAAAARARDLATPDRAGAVATVRRRGIVRARELRAMGLAAPYRPVAGDWLVDPEHHAMLRGRLESLVAGYAAERPDLPGPPVEEARRRLELPDQRLVAALASPPLVVTDGHVAHRETGPALPSPVRAAAETLLAELADHPYAAPSAQRLSDLGLDARALAAVVRTGALLHLGGRVYLAATAVDQAVKILAALPQPFTVSQARVALGTSRRVAVPLLELLDRQGRTARTDDGSRRVLPRDGRVPRLPGPDGSG